MRVGRWRLWRGLFISPRQLAACYALIATISLLVVAPTMPPFSNADEENHVLRADMIAQGRLVGAPIVHTNIHRAAVPFGRLMFYSERRVERGDYRALDWGTLAPGAFANTLIYPPTFYVPAAIALRAAQLLHLPVLRGLLAARLATGAATIGVGALAISLAEGAAAWLALILLLPMSLALTAAVSQDGPMLAATALAVALWGMVARGGGGRVFAALCALLAAVAMARPPYAAFAFILLALKLPAGARWGGVGFVLACAGLWSAVQAAHVVLPGFPEGTPDPGRQALLMFQHPHRIAVTLFDTFHTYRMGLWEGFVGRPGYLDVALPPGIVPCAGVVLLVVFAASLDRPRAITGGAVAAAVGGAVLGIAVLQYLTWTPVGARLIDGLQGRYFLAVALMLGCVAWRERAPVGWLVLGFGAVSTAALVHAVVMRYYFV